jgi:hypothetical protein
MEGINMKNYILTITMVMMLISFNVYGMHSSLEQEIDNLIAMLIDKNSSTWGEYLPELEKLINDADKAKAAGLLPAVSKQKLDDWKDSQNYFEAFVGKGRKKEEERKQHDIRAREENERERIKQWIASEKAIKVEDINFKNKISSLSELLQELIKGKKSGLLFDIKPGDIILLVGQLDKAVTLQEEFMEARRDAGIKISEETAKKIKDSRDKLTELENALGELL